MKEALHTIEKLNTIYQSLSDILHCVLRLLRQLEITIRFVLYFKKYSPVASSRNNNKKVWSVISGRLKLFNFVETEIIYNVQYVRKDLKFLNIKSKKINKFLSYFYWSDFGVGIDCR